MTEPYGLLRNADRLQEQSVCVSIFALAEINDKRTSRFPKRDMFIRNAVLAETSFPVDRSQRKRANCTSSEGEQ